MCGSNTVYLRFWAGADWFNISSLGRQDTLVDTVRFEDVVHVEVLDVSDRHEGRRLPRYGGNKKWVITLWVVVELGMVVRARHD